MTKYKEIMSRVSVTPEMRKRVLDYVSSHRNEAMAADHNKKSNIRRWMRWVPAVAAACFLLVIGLQFYHINELKNEPFDVATDSMIEYDSLKELNGAFRFEINEVTQLPFEPSETIYWNAFGVARIDYYSLTGDNITLSVARDDGTDISGDYNEYEYVTEKTINGVTVTIKGDNETVSLATWTQDGYAYAIGAVPGIDMESMEAMVSGILDQK